MAGNDASSTGLPKRSRRAKVSMVLLEELVARNIAAGMDEGEARTKALEELKNNNRSDWRAR